MDKIIVTRHGAMVEYLIEQGIVDSTVPIVEHASAKQIEGKHVIGFLPLHLACQAERLTEIPMNVPLELRGRELTLEQVRELAGKPQTYQVRRV